MSMNCAFQFDDLVVLLGLQRDEPTDQADIEAINAVLTRRRAAITANPADEQVFGQNRTPLHLVLGTFDDNQPRPPAPAQ
jgi:hypothetical protein